jgi:hypothetical protein
VWQFLPRFNVAEQYDFWDFRQPADNCLSEINRFDVDIPAPPFGGGSPGTLERLAI